MKRHAAPSPGSVDLWGLDPTRLSADQWSSLSTSLPESEVREAHESASPSSARERIASRALLRRALASYLGRAPSTFRFQADPRGKLRVDGIDTECLELSVAHTEGLVLCAIARAPLGVDAELNERPEPGAVAGHYFTPAEQVELALHGALRREHFYKHWTVKEAVLKARGTGLGELARVECRFRGSELDLHVRESESPTRSYSVETWRATARHQVAVALTGWAGPLRIRTRSLMARDGLLCGPRGSPSSLHASNHGA